MAITLIASLSCEPTARFVISDVTPRHTVRPDAVGCWSLRADAKGISVAQSLLIQLDTVGAVTEAARGVHVVHRLDPHGQALLRDAEGFTLLDTWTADAASDSVRLVFNNGLYGSFWTLHLPAQHSSVDSMVGFSRLFGDVVPGPDYPLQYATATRVRCQEPTARAAGV